jgi:hypothetical protein
MSFMFVLQSWDRSVSIVAMLWAGRSRSRFLAVTSDFYLLHHVHTSSGTNPASYSGGPGGFSPEVMCEADNSLLSTAKDKNE